MKRPRHHSDPPHLERGDAVSVFLVVVPLAFILESVRPLRHAKPGPLVVLPLARVRLHHVGVQLLVLRVWGELAEGGGPDGTHEEGRDGASGRRSTAGKGY